MAQLLSRSWTGADGTSWEGVGFRKVRGGAGTAVVASNKGRCGAVASERYFAVTGWPPTPNVLAAVDLVWGDGPGSSRVPSLGASWSEDGLNGYLVEIDSNFDAPQARLRRLRNDAWTTLVDWFDLTAAPHALDGADLNAGITVKLRRENLTDKVKLTLIIQGQTVFTYEDTSSSRIEGIGLVVVGIDSLSTVGDVTYDNASVDDFVTEWAGTGSLSTGIAIEVDSVYYSAGDLTAARISVGRGRTSFDKEDVWEFRTPAKVAAADTVLYPGAVVKVFIDGITKAFGRIRPATRDLRPGEGRAYQLMGVRGLAAEVPIQDPVTGAGTMVWNLPEDHADYDASRADKEGGEQIKLLLDEHVDGPTGLRAHLAAPPDENTAPYVQAELDLVTVKVPGSSATQNVVMGVEQILAKTKYALRIDPDTRVWHIVPRMAGTIRQLDFDTEKMTADYGVRPERNRTAILVLGDRPEVEEIAFDNGIVALGQGLAANLEKGWPESLEATHTSEKAKRNRDDGTVQSTSGAGASVAVTPDPATLELEAHEWIGGTIGFLDGDEEGEIYDLEDNTGAELNVEGPWRNGGPAPGDTFVVQGNGAGGGRDNGHVIMGRRYEFSDAALGVPKDACADVKILSERGANLLTTAKFVTPDDPAEPTEVILEHPSIGLFNPTPEGRPEPCEDGGAVEEARVEFSVPTYSRTDPRVPRLWFPTTDDVEGYRGTAFTFDDAKWDGAGAPGKGDVGVMEPEPLNLPEFDGSPAMVTQVEAMCAELLTFLAPLAREVVITCKDTLRTDVELGERIQILGGPTELETVEDLDVLAIEWDPMANTTTYYLGTVACGDYNLAEMRRGVESRLLTRTDRSKMLRLQDYINCLAQALHAPGYARKNDIVQMCADDVTSAVTKDNRSVREDIVWIEIWILELWAWLSEQKGIPLIVEDGTLWGQDGDGQWWWLDENGQWRRSGGGGPVSEGGTGPDANDSTGPGPMPTHPDGLGNGGNQGGMIETIFWNAIKGILANLGKTIDLKTGRVILPGTVNNGASNPNANPWVTFGPDTNDDGEPERTPVDWGEAAPPTTEDVLALTVRGILHNLGKTVDANGNVLTPGGTVPAGGGTHHKEDGTTAPLAPGATVPEEPLTALQKNKAAMEKLLLGHLPGSTGPTGNIISAPGGSTYRLTPAGYELLSGPGLAGPAFGGAVGHLAAKCGTTFSGRGTFGSGPGTGLLPGEIVDEDSAYYYPPTGDPDDVLVLNVDAEVPATSQMIARALVRDGRPLEVHDLTDPGGVIYRWPPGGGTAVTYWRCEPSTVLMRRVEEDPGVGLNGGDWSWFIPTATAARYGATQIPWLEAVRYATAAALPACTATATTLEANANGALTIDGATSAAGGQRVLVKDQADDTQNGIYVIDSWGSAGSKWSMTRAHDADGVEDLLLGMVVTVKFGTANANKGFRYEGDSPATPGTDAQVWSAWPAGGTGDFLADGSVPMTGDFDAGGNKLTNLDDPTAADDAATKGYADALLPQLPYTFARNNLPASQTALLILGPQATTGFTVHAAGSLRALTALFTGTFNAGQIKVRVRKNGTASTALELTATAGTGSGCVATGAGVSFAAGDYLQLEVDSDGTFNGTSGVWSFVAILELARV